MSAAAEMDDVDYFTDIPLCADPYPYYEHLRDKGPVSFDTHHHVAMVSGYGEALAVYNDADNFSACNTVSGPLPPLPFVPEGDDISDQIDAHRHLFPSCELLITYDRPDHSPARSLLMRLFTPRRLIENEAYIRSLSQRLAGEMLANGNAEVVSELGGPFATLVIADLLGIPEEDRAIYRDRLNGVPGAIGDDSGESSATHPLTFLHDSFTSYIEDRRAAPRGDVLSDLANTAYPNGEMPSAIDVVRVAVNLFAAGQETTARLLATLLRILAEDPDLQQRLRKQPDLIPAFVEEGLRLEGPVKTTFRLARRTTQIGQVEVKAGTTVMTAVAGINRDPRRYDRPDEIVLDRPKLREHLAFGRGVHTCPGAPLARVEVRIMLEELLARTTSITVSDAYHGPEGSRRFDYAATYLLRGLNSLNLVFVPA
jgi:cytochrome P450